MQMNISKNEKIIGYITFFGILFFFVLFIQLNHKSKINVSPDNAQLQVDYKMARPEESFSEYSLNGREVDEEFEASQKLNPHVKSSQTNSEIANKAKTVQNGKPVADLKASQAVNNQKSADLKKNAQANKNYQNYLQQQKAQQEKIAQSNLNKDKQTALAANDKISETPNKNNETKNGAQNMNPNINSGAARAESPINANVSPQANQATSFNQIENDIKKQSQKKKTFSEWRSFIFEKPNQQSMDSFIQAYRNKELTTTEFQAMVQDLLDQNEDTFKNLSLYALRAQPSLISLSLLVHHESEMNENFKVYIEKTFLTYLQKQNLPILNQALQTKDKILILKTLNLLNTQLQKISKSDFSGLLDNRNMRDAAMLDVYSIGNFKQLVPSLSQLSSTQESEVASMAQQVSQVIQSAAQIALN